MRLNLFLTMVLAVFISAVAYGADVPELINYQGRLTDASGDPLDDGVYDLMFTIYDDSAVGSALWTSGPQPVQVTNGLFTYRLGSASPLLPSVFGDSALWLGIAVDGDPETTPRTRLTSVPYACQAQEAESAVNADKLDGYDAGNGVGQVPVSNGTRCDSLNAHMLNGRGGGEYTLENRYFVDPSGGPDSADIAVIHYKPQQLIIGELDASPSSDGLAFLYLVENDGYIRWLGYDGLGNQVIGGAWLGSQTTILTLRGGNIVLKTAGDGDSLRLTSSEEVKAILMY